MQFVCAAALAAFLPACTTTGGMASASPQTETMLTQAGFTTHVATTAKQKAHIQSMPNGKLTMVKKNGKKVWIYPDVAHNQIYVGNQAQYQAFRSARAAQSRQEMDDDSLVAIYPSEMGVPIEVYEGWVPFDQL